MSILASHTGTHGRSRFWRNPFWDRHDRIRYAIWLALRETGRALRTARALLRAALDGMSGDDQWEHGLDDRDIADLFDQPEPPRQVFVPGVFLPVTLPEDHDQTDIISAVRVSAGREVAMVPWRPDPPAWVTEILTAPIESIRSAS
jgi:anti-sigma factor ChrR (cupin superfamily)